MKTFKDIILEDGGAAHVASQIDIDLLRQKLESAICEEYLAWYQYHIVSKFLRGNERSEIADAFDDNGKDELEDHSDKLLERLNQLGFYPDAINDPANWNVIATHKYIIPDNSYTVKTAIEQNIQAERNAIETYKDLEMFTRDKDIVTNHIIKSILEDEESHLQKLIEFKDDLTENI